MAHRASLAMSRASSEISDVVIEGNPAALGSPRSIAYLVYANRGDPYTAGYKPPTTRDIPQMKLPRVETASNSEIADYMASVRASGKAYETQRRDPDTDREIEALETVPDVFFSDQFQLNNPRTFDAVIGDNDSVVTQEKLSWYVDIVEAHLAQEIAHASTQFFEATAQFTTIEDQARITSKSMTEFADIVSAQQQVVAHYQETADLQRKLADANKLVAGMEYLKKVSAAVDDLENTVTGEVEAGVAKLSEVRAGLNNEDFDLRRLIAAQPLLERVEIAENNLKNKLQTQYTSAMLSALRLQLSAVGEDDPSNVAKRAELLSKAATILDYATHLGARSSVLNQYRLEVDREVKLVVRRNLPVSDSASNQSANPEESQFLARSLHALSPDDAERMCHDIFSQLMNLLEVVKCQNVPDIGPRLMEDLVTGADSRLARVLRVRKDPASLLSAPQFLRFFAQVTEFCDFVENLTTVRATELREFLVAQTKLYVHCLHDSFDSALSEFMDADDWKRTEVTKETQKYATWIDQSALSDPPLESEDTEIAHESEDVSKMEGIDDKNGAINGGAARLEVGSQPFLLGKSASFLLGGLSSFLQLICYLPPAQSILAARAILELLQAFNHKTYAQVVGHGAIKTAGLRHINIRNLLLAHESLRMVETLLAPLRKCVERHSGVNGLAFLENHSVGSAAMEVSQSFDAVQQKYFDHRSEIHQRLVKLLGDKAITAAKYILDTDWSNPRTEAQNNGNNGNVSGVRSDAKSNVSTYMVELMRQTTLVARVAQEMIPANIAEDIISKTYASYKAKLLEAFSMLDIHTPQEKRNVLRDVEYFRTKSTALKGAGNTGDVIYESVSNFVAPEIDINMLEPEDLSTLPGDQSMDRTMDQTLDQTIDDPSLTSVKSPDSSVPPNSILHDLTKQEATTSQDADSAKLRSEEVSSETSESQDKESHAQIAPKWEHSAMIDHSSQPNTGINVEQSSPPDTESNTEPTFVKEKTEKKPADAAADVEKHPSDSGVGVESTVENAAVVSDVGSRSSTPIEGSSLRELESDAAIIERKDTSPSREQGLASSQANPVTSQLEESPINESLDTVTGVKVHPSEENSSKHTQSETEATNSETNVTAQQEIDKARSMKDQDENANGEKISQYTDVKAGDPNHNNEKGGDEKDSTPEKISDDIPGVNASEENAITDKVIKEKGNPRNVGTEGYDRNDDLLRTHNENADGKNNLDQSEKENGDSLKESSNPELVAGDEAEPASDGTKTGSDEAKPAASQSASSNAGLSKSQKKRLKKKKKSK